MAGRGTGYPNYFMCPDERRERSRNWVGSRYDRGQSQVQRENSMTTDNDPTTEAPALLTDVVDLDNLLLLASSHGHENSTWAAYCTNHGDPYVVGVGDDGVSRQLFGAVCQVDKGPKDYGRNLATYIAACDPDTITALVAELIELRVAVADAIAVLESEHVQFKSEHVASDDEPFCYVCGEEWPCSESAKVAMALRAVLDGAS